MTEPAWRARTRRRETLRSQDASGVERDLEQLTVEIAESSTPASRRNRKLAWIVAWVVATALLIVCFRVVGVSRLLDVASRIRPGWAALSIAANFLIQVCSAITWKLLLPPGLDVSFKRVLSIMLIGALVVNTTPMLVGHASIALMLARQRGVGNAGALSVLALDQVAEGLSKLIVITAALILVPVPVWLRQGGVVLAFVMAGVITVLMLAARRHRAIERWSHSRHAITKFIARWAHHLEPLRNVRRFGLACLASLGMKAAELVGIIAAQHALGVDLPTGHSLLVLAAAGLGTILPVTPGNIGLYEGAVLLAYRFLGLDAQTALALALVQHLSFLVASTVPGWVAVGLKQFRTAEPAR